MEENMRDYNKDMVSTDEVLWRNETWSMVVPYLSCE